MNSVVYRLLSALAVIGLMASLNICNASLLSIEVEQPSFVANWDDCDLTLTTAKSDADSAPTNPKRQLDSPSGVPSSMAGSGFGSVPSFSGPIGLTTAAAWAADLFSTRFIVIYKIHRPPLVVALDFKIPIA